MAAHLRQEQIRRKAKALLLLLRLRKHFASFAAFASFRLAHKFVATYCCCCCFCCCSRSWSFPLNYFRRTKKKEIFPRRSACVCVCVCVCLPAIAHDTATIRQSDTSVRQFVTSTMFLPKFLRGEENKVKIEGRYELCSSTRPVSVCVSVSTRRVSFLLCRKRSPKNERSITNSTHLAFGSVSVSSALSLSTLHALRSLLYFD